MFIIASFRTIQQICHIHLLGDKSASCWQNWTFFICYQVTFHSLMNFWLRRTNHLWLDWHFVLLTNVTMCYICFFTHWEVVWNKTLHLEARRPFVAGSVTFATYCKCKYIYIFCLITLWMRDGTNAHTPNQHKHYFLFPSVRQKRL